jgi:hypothetical protein
MVQERQQPRRPPRGKRRRAKHDVLPYRIGPGLDGRRRLDGLAIVMDPYTAKVVPETGFSLRAEARF